MRVMDQRVWRLLWTMTDNKNRTVAEIRHLMNKYGGNLGENGSVWMFEKLGQIIIESNLIDEEKLLSDGQGRS